MTEESTYERVQTGAFSRLVSDGTYSRDFTHGPVSQDLFSRAVANVSDDLVDRFGSDIHVLDCGCGNGAWLDFLLHLPLSGSISEAHGYDLTPAMVELARERLECAPVPLQLQVGNVLDEAAYSTSGARQQFELIYTYDVIQQLPRKLQYRACELLVSRVAPGGVAIIFDNDCASPFGKKMGRKKFLTRYLGLPLVPRYYCNARYPALETIAGRLSADLGVSCDTVIASDQCKRALLVRVPT